MKRTWLTVLAISPLIWACTSESGRTSYQYRSANDTVRETTTPIPGMILDTDVPAPVPVPSPTVRPEPVAVPIPPAPTKNNRIVFGDPGQSFDLEGFIPPGFSPEKTISEETFIRERNNRGCTALSSAGLNTGAEIVRQEATFHQFNQTPVYFQMTSLNRLMSVKDGTLTYKRLYKDLQVDAAGSALTNSEVSCKYVWGATGGFRSCPFMTGNESFNKYLSQISWGKACSSSAADRRKGLSRDAIYTRGKFVLPGGREVQALLSRTHSERIENCDGIKRKFDDYQVQVITDKIQSADGPCAVAFDLTIYKSKDRYSEWSKALRSANIKK